jgi:hypothetical protein
MSGIQRRSIAMLLFKSQKCTTREAPCATWPHLRLEDQEHVNFIEVLENDTPAEAPSTLGC